MSIALAGELIKLAQRPKIVAAAIRRSGMVYFVERPGRHHDVLRKMAASGLKLPIKGEQGFVTSEGKFVNRKVALGIAVKAEQPMVKNGPVGLLFSEDLW